MWKLPRFTWLLTLLVLFAFAMPVLGAGTGPPGDVVIEQAMFGTLDPVPVLEAQEFVPAPLLALIKTGSIQNTLDTFQYPTALALAARYAVKLPHWSPALILVRSTFYETDASRQPEGVVAFRRSDSSGGLRV
jgi:hypothetical protein